MRNPVLAFLWVVVVSELALIVLYSTGKVNW
jgi:hypothetical protein